MPQNQILPNQRHESERRNLCWSANGRVYEGPNLNKAEKRGYLCWVEMGHSFLRNKPANDQEIIEDLLSADKVCN